MSYRTITKAGLLAILLIMVIACNHRKEESKSSDNSTLLPSEAYKRKVFEDSIAIHPLDFPDKLFGAFLHRYYPDLKTKTPSALLYALEEPIIDTTKIDFVEKWVRITVDPCFRLPYCLILQDRKDNDLLTIKISNGFGCQYPGLLASTTKMYFTGNLYDTISKTINNIDFWKLDIDTTCHGGLDGEMWLIEAVEKGKYNAVYRWAPQNCGNSTTIGLSKIGIKLGRVGKLDSILEALGANKSGL